MGCFSRFQHYEFSHFEIFLTFNVIIQISQLNRKSRVEFDNNLLENVFGHELVFNFYYHKFKQFLCNLMFFFKF